MENFVELTVYTTHDGAEIVSDILWEYTDSGVVVSDIEDVISLSKEGKSWDYADEGIFSADKTVVVKAYYPIENAKEIIKDIENSLLTIKALSPFDLGTLETAKRNIDGDEWRETWKEHFKPIHIGRIVIVPEWIPYKKQENEIEVRLDSNMAFGTGEHETTAMCLEFLEEFVKPEQTVLDVGTGSGILGISASKLGAKKVVMTDIDECAITASKHNAKLNGIKNCDILLKNLLDDNSVKGDVIVCNIMAELLISFAPFIGENLNGNGIIILSGILADRLDKVKKAYEENGFVFVKEKIKGEWSALVMKKL